MTLDDVRRIAGLLFGAGLGLEYGLVSQFVNAFLLPGIDLYQPPLGPALNVVLIVCVVTVIVLVSAWPAEPAHGIFFGSAIGAVLIQINTLTSGAPQPQEVLAKIVLTLLIFLPLTAMAALPVGLLRWAISKQAAYHGSDARLWERVRLPLVLTAATFGLGLISMTPEDGRAMLARTHNLIQTGLQAANDSELPPALRTKGMTGFLQQAEDRYTLMWERNDLNRFQIPRPTLIDDWKHSVVLARFDNGWRLACLYLSVEAEPICRPYRGE